MDVGNSFTSKHEYNRDKIIPCLYPTCVSNHYRNPYCWHNRQMDGYFISHFCIVRWHGRSYIDANPYWCQPSSLKLTTFKHKDLQQKKNRFKASKLVCEVVQQVPGAISRRNGPHAERRSAESISFLMPSRLADYLLIDTQVICV